MRKFNLVLVLVFVIACKNEKKEKVNSEQEINNEIISNTPKVLIDLILPNYPLWTFKGLSFEKSTLKDDLEGAFNVVRNTTTETSYTMIKDIPVVNNSKHRLSILVKQGNVGCCFGLRIMGNYPNRIDAVFDLDKGVVKETKSTGDFLSGETEIEKLDNNWFRCTLTSKLEVDEVNIIFGPTNNSAQTITWEANTNNLNDIYIIPTSLSLEEISN